MFIACVFILVKTTICQGANAYGSSWTVTRYYYFADDTLHCTDEVDCTLNCFGRYACGTATIIGPSNAILTVTCDSYRSSSSSSDQGGSCYQLTIDASQSSSLFINVYNGKAEFSQSDINAPNNGAYGSYSTFIKCGIIGSNTPTTANDDWPSCGYSNTIYAVEGWKDVEWTYYASNSWALYVDSSSQMVCGQYSQSSCRPWSVISKRYKCATASICDSYQIPTSALPTISNPTLSPITANPTNYPTKSPTESPTTYNPTYAPTKATNAPSISPTMTAVEIKVKRNGKVFYVIIIGMILGLMLLIMSIWYFCVSNMMSRTTLYGTAGYIDTLKMLSLFDNCCLILEIFDIISDYLFAMELITNNATNNYNQYVLGWISLICGIIGFILFILKFFTMKKLIGYQISKIIQEIEQTKITDNIQINFKIQKIKEIRIRQLDIEIINLLISLFDDIPQILIVIIFVSSNIESTFFSIISIAFSILTFSLKLMKIVAIRFGCKDNNKLLTQNEI